MGPPVHRAIARTIALVGPPIYAKRFVYVMCTQDPDERATELIGVIPSDAQFVYFIFDTALCVNVRVFSEGVIVQSMVIEKRRHTPERLRFEYELLDYILSLPPADMCCGLDVRQRDDCIEIVEASYAYVRAFESVVDELIDD